jgi:hypothetical protein
VQKVERAAADGYTDITVVTSLDPRPTAAARGLKKALPDQGFFDTVDYYGAFSTDQDWTRGWSLISAMGVMDTDEPVGDTQTVDLVKGWNWISFNTLPTDTSLENVLAGYGPQDEDSFKSTSETATYFGGQWYGLEDGIEAGSMYLLGVQQDTPGSLQISGTAVDPELPIGLVTGWNWVGFPGRQTVSVNDAMANYPAQDEDTLKSATDTATFFGGQWYGLNDGLHPGVGYKLRVAVQDPPELVFAVSATRGGDVAAVRDQRVGPSWETPLGYENNMTVHAAVFVDGARVVAEGSMLAAFHGDELRGATDLFSGPAGAQFQLTVVSNETEGENITFQVYDAGTGQILDITETATFAVNGVLGAINQPEELNTTSGGAQAPDWQTPEGYENNMTVHAVVRDAQGQLVTAEGSMLAAFHGEEIRGATEIFAGPSGQQFQLTVVSNQAEETGLLLRVYDAATGTVSDITQPLDFEVNAVVGGIGSPQEYNVGAAPVVPELSIDDVSHAEGDQGSTTYVFTLSLSAETESTVTVTYATVDDSATVADGDYQAQSGQLTFSPGETVKTVTVQVQGDTTPEPDEQFFVELLTAVNATIADGQGVGVIRNDDNAAPVLVTATPEQDPILDEGDAQTFTVQAEDPDGDAIISFTWSLNGEVLDSPVRSTGDAYTLETDNATVDHIEDGDTRDLVLEVFATDARGNDSATRSWTVTVRDVNAVPVIGATEVSFSPLQPRTADDLVAPLTRDEISDADAEDTVRYRFQWSVNGASVRDQVLLAERAVADTLPSSAFAKGDRVSVAVTGLDYAGNTALGGESAAAQTETTVLNTAPVATDDQGEVRVGTTETTTIAVLDNDSDADGRADLDPGAVTVVTPPELGGVTVTQDGAIVYTLTAGMDSGTDTFAYTVADLDGAESNTATVTIDILPVGAPWYPTFDVGIEGIADVTIRDAVGESVLRAQITDTDTEDGQNVFGPNQYISGTGEARTGLLPGAYTAEVAAWNQDLQAFEEVGEVLELPEVEYSVPAAPAPGDMGSTPAGDGNRSWALLFTGNTVAQGLVIEVRDADDGTLVRSLVQEFRPAGEGEPFPTEPADEQLTVVTFSATGTYQWRLRFFTPLDRPSAQEAARDDNWSAWMDIVELTDETIGEPRKPVLPPVASRHYVPEIDAVLNADPETGYAVLDFSWTAAAHADGYYVYIATQEGEVAVNREFVGSPEFPAVPLVPGHYRWSVLPVNTELGNDGFADDWMKPMPTFTILPATGGVDDTPGMVTVDTAKPLVRNAEDQVVIPLRWTGNVSDDVRILVLFPGIMLEPADDQDNDPATFTTDLLNADLAPGDVTFLKLQGVGDGSNGPWSLFIQVTIP